MKVRKALLFALFLVGIPAFGQPVIGHFFSLGVTGGGSLTDAFSDETVTGVDVVSRYFSGSKDYIVGPAIEVHLPFRLSVEFDALYRPLNLTSSNTIVPDTVPFSYSDKLISWEFPLLAKYRLPVHPVRPFLETGPSFRTMPDFPADSPHLSRDGFTAGGGVELKLGPIQIEPEIRYTRWGADSRANLYDFSPVSNVNQAELLLGLSF